MRRKHEDADARREANNAQKRKRYHEVKNTEEGEKRRLRAKERVSKNRERIRMLKRLWNKQYRLKNPDKVKESNRRGHKMPEPTRPEPQICEVCAGQETTAHRTSGTVFSLCLDHCHKTNTFRGWLCSRCNLTIGRCKDDPTILRNMAQYLDNHKQQLETNNDIQRNQFVANSWFYAASTAQSQTCCR